MLLSCVNVLRFQGARNVLKLLRSDLFNALMQVLFVASILELFLGNGAINSAAISVTLLASSIGMFSGLAAKASGD